MRASASPASGALGMIRRFVPIAREGEGDFSWLVAGGQGASVDLGSLKRSLRPAQKTAMGRQATSRGQPEWAAPRSSQTRGDDYGYHRTGENRNVRCSGPRVASSSAMKAARPTHVRRRTLDSDCRASPTATPLNEAATSEASVTSACNRATRNASAGRDCRSPPARQRCKGQAVPPRAKEQAAYRQEAP